MLAPFTAGGVFNRRSVFGRSGVFGQRPSAQGEALPNFHSKLAAIKQSGSGRANIGLLSDSIGEGASATSHLLNYQYLLAEALRAYAGLPVSGAFFACANYITGAELWTYGGAASTPAVTFGYGFRHRQLANTSTATLIFYGTDVDVYFLRAYSSAGGTYTIDGGAPVAFTTAFASTDRRVFSDACISITGLSAGFHTLVITATGGCFLEGAYYYNGDKTTGIHIWDCSHAGWRALDHAAQNTYCAANSVLNVAQADLIIIPLGLNDFFQNLTKASFEASTRRIIRQLRQTRPRCDIVLVKEQTTGAWPNPDDPDWANWRAIFDTLGAEMSIPVWDYQEAIGSFASPGNPYDVGDTIHPNDAGHAALSAYFLAKLTAGVVADPGRYTPRIKPVQTSYQSDSPNLLTNTDISTWTPVNTPVVTSPGGTVDGYPVARIQDNSGTLFEGVYTAMPTLLAGRRYRMTVHAKLTDWAIGATDGAALLQMQKSDGAAGIGVQQNLTAVTNVLSSYGSLSALGIAGANNDHYAGSAMPSPFDPTNWYMISLDFKVGASDIVTPNFVIHPTAGSVAHQATISFARPTLQLLGDRE